MPYPSRIFCERVGQFREGGASSLPALGMTFAFTFRNWPSLGLDLTILSLYPGRSSAQQTRNLHFLTFGRY